MTYDLKKKNYEKIFYETVILNCAHYNTKIDTFFNRKREIVKFTNIFSAPKPRLHVILGPPSTGKTALVREVVTNKGNFKTLFLDCHSGQFDSPKNLYSSISMQFKPFFKELLKKILPEKDLKTIFPYFFELNLKLFDKKEENFEENEYSEIIKGVNFKLGK